ncbi:hypothetical protein [Streptomyces bacillaris]|uniref:hypothetical protein n=1 Tax=Streptomyces bacillaris TaxID=68179 RepID=UPI00346731FF
MTRARRPKPLPPLAASIYRWSREHGGISTADRAVPAHELHAAADDVEQALTVLVSNRLLMQTADAYVPAGPDSAVAELTAPVELEIKELEHYAGDLTAQVPSPRAMHFQIRRARNSREAVDIIEGQGRVRSLLDSYASRCRSEVFSAYPGTTTRDCTETWLPRYAETSGGPGACLLLASGTRQLLVDRRVLRSAHDERRPLPTCRRHIAEVMLDLRASSCFQAGVNVRRSGPLTAGHARRGRGGRGIQDCRCHRLSRDFPPAPVGVRRALVVLGHVWPAMACLLDRLCR